MSLQRPCKPMAPNAFVPHPLPSGTVPFRGLPIYPGCTAWLLVPLLPEPAPVGRQHPHCTTSACLSVSSLHSFFHPPFSPTYLFVLTLAESLRPVSSNPGALLFPRTFWFPHVEWGSEKALPNICENAHRFWVVSLNCARMLFCRGAVLKRTPC